MKEIALLTLGALVIQNMVSGAVLNKPIVALGFIASTVLYYQAKRLVEKV